MRVRFVGGRGGVSGNDHGADRLVVGGDYVVLEVFSSPGAEVFLRVEHRRGETPALFDSRLFDVVDDSVPPVWRVRLMPSGSVVFGPEPWLGLDYWGRVMDGEPAAVAVFDQFRDVVVGQS